MRTTRLILLGLMATMLTSCSESIVDSSLLSEEGGALEASASPAKQGKVLNFVAVLEGAQEVPAVDTRARGVAKFQLSKDGQTLSYRLNVANIEDVLMAHIHLAPRGQNGGVVVWLYPSAPPAMLISGRSNGTLATGEITAANLVGSLADGSMEDLIAAIRAGNAYVNVHTLAFGGGEIRGQIDVGNGMK